MLVLNSDVFDESISGTATNWYTSSRYDKVLGEPDELAVMALVTNVSGSGAALTVYGETTADDRNWFAINGTNPNFTVGLSEGAMGIGFSAGSALSSFRLRIALTGTNPACRLKLSVTGRNID